MIMITLTHNFKFNSDFFLFHKEVNIKLIFKKIAKKSIVLYISNLSY